VGSYFSSNRFGDNFSNQNMGEYAAANVNQLRYNEFGNGIKAFKNWGTGQSGLLLSDTTVRLVAVGNTNTVVLMYQDSAGAVLTGAV
jgi:hypothetical protein